MFNNFFAIIHRIIKSCFTHPIRFAALKFAIITPVLIGLLWFYVECNKIPHFVDTIAIDRIGGEVNNEHIDVFVQRNYSASYNRGLFALDDELDSLYEGSYNLVQIISKAKKGTLKNGKAPGDLHCNETLDTYLEWPKNEFPHWRKEIDSLDVLYHIITQHEIHDNSLNKVLVTGNVKENINPHPFWICYPTYSDEKTFYDKQFVEIGYAIGFRDYFSGVFHTGASSQKFSYFAPYDISQAYQTFNLDSPLDSISLSFFYWGNTEFSKMNPAPDDTGMSSIIFNSPEKIEEIKKHSLSFHARFSDTANIQDTRMFILATMITVVLSYWITLLGSIVANSIRNYHFRK